MDSAEQTTLKEKKNTRGKVTLCRLVAHTLDVDVLRPDTTMC